ncbi:MAG: hypothetical protein PHE58_04155 [Candidatus Omnitrophica bacterium]|nr:hypothetical protein [Candidatus Omnitrophota bacterium]
MLNKKGLSLAETIVVLVLICILLLSVYSVYLIFLTSINYDMERYSIYAQVNYALDDIKLRSLSASSIRDNSLFTYGSGEVKNRMEFTGEKDIYKVTPDDLSDDVTYTYTIDNNALVLLSSDGTREVLIEGRYKPVIEFMYRDSDEPNFMTVSITATGTKNFGKDTAKISKTEGVRFWFVDVVRK